MLNKSHNYIAVSFSEDVLRVVETATAGNSIKLEQVSIENVQGSTEAQWPKIVQSALRKFKPKSGNLIYVVPSGMTTSKNIEIPSTNDDEIKSIVNLQAPRHTPYSREEIQIGYVNLGVYKVNYSKVLLVITNKSVLKKHLSAFEKAGFPINKVLFAPEGLASFYTRILNLRGETLPSGIVDIGQHATDFVIVFKGKPITARNIPVGKSHLISDGPGSVHKLHEELFKTVEAYKTEDIEQPPQKFFLTSSDEHTKSLQTLLQDQLKWDVQISPYIDQVKSSPGVLKSLGQAMSQHSFLDVIASASAAYETQVNLMPEEVQLQKSIESQGKEVLKTAILGFIALILLVGLLTVKMYFQSSFLSKLKKDYEGSRQEVASLENRSIKTKILQKFFEERMISLDVVHEIYKNVPNEIYLTAISMDPQGNISVQGISDAGSIVYSVNSKLKESPLFLSADVKSKTAKKDRGKDVHAFEIVLKMKHAADLSSGAKQETREEGSK